MEIELWQIVGNAAFDDEFYQAMADASQTDLPAEWRNGNSMGGETSNVQALSLPSLWMTTDQDEQP